MKWLGTIVLNEPRTAPGVFPSSFHIRTVVWSTRGVETGGTGSLCTLLRYLLNPGWGYLKIIAYHCVSQDELFQYSLDVDTWGLNQG